jgi:hypothetical protein
MVWDHGVYFSPSSSSQGTSYCWWLSCMLTTTAPLWEAFPLERGGVALFCDKEGLLLSVND